MIIAEEVLNVKPIISLNHFTTQPLNHWLNNKILLIILYFTILQYF